MIQNSGGALSIIIGAGEQVLSGTGTYTGSTTVSNGTLTTLAGPVLSNLTAASANQALGTGRLTIASGATVNIGYSGLQGSYYNMANLSNIRLDHRYSDGLLGRECYAGPAKQCVQCDQLQRHAIRLRQRLEQLA